MIRVLDHGYVQLVDSMPAVDTDLGLDYGPGDARVVEAARVSIAGEEVRPVIDDRKLIRYLYENQHLTPFEQVRFTFRVKLPIFVARQWIRHRTGSFNEMSARYGKLPCDYYVPDTERMNRQSSNNKQGSALGVISGAREAQHSIRQHSREAYDLYEGLLDRGLARELARMVLPVNFYTKWYWTTDLRNLIHFLRLRLDPHAQYEAQVYARAVRELACPVAPYSLKVALDV